MFKVKRRLRSRDQKKQGQKSVSDSLKRGSASSCDASSSGQSGSAQSGLSGSGQSGSFPLRSILKTTSDCENSYASNASHSRNSSERTGESYQSSANNTETSNFGIIPKAVVHHKGRGHRLLRRVSFNTVHVREYERALGDNPSCSSGAPITIGWSHSKELEIAVDDFENARFPRRSQPELVLTRQDREELLLEWGASFNEIIDAIRTNVRVKNQRRRTVNSIGTYDRWEEAMENASRKIKKTLMLQKASQIPPWRNDTKTPGPQLATVVEAIPSNTPPPLPSYSLNAEQSQSNGDFSSMQRLAQPSTSPCDQPSTKADTTPTAAISNSPSAVGLNSSLPPSDCNRDIEENKDICMPDMHVEEDGTISQRRPAPLIEIDVSNDNATLCDSVISASDVCGNSERMDYCDFDEDEYLDEEELLYQHELQLYQEYAQRLNAVQQQQPPPPPPMSYVNTPPPRSTAGDELDHLHRDYSHWELGGTDGPSIRRRITPVIICEDDSPYFDVADNAPVSPQQYEYNTKSQWDYPCFPLQAPPHSSALISNWE